jgi:hypothetical protein
MCAAAMRREPYYPWIPGAAHGRPVATQAPSIPADAAVAAAVSGEAHNSPKVSSYAACRQTQALTVGLYLLGGLIAGPAYRAMVSDHGKREAGPRNAKILLESREFD